MHSYGATKMPPISCTECRTRLPEQAEACPECGYPVTGHGHCVHGEDSETARAALKEYKLLQITGVAVVMAGVIAAAVDSPIAAAVAVTVGVATYITGLLGVWWNTGS
jgi:predicted amidophosphoribosyltransferase